MFKIATPCSTLITDKKSEHAVCSRSDAIELRRVEDTGKSGLPELFHCELSVVQRWSEADRDELRELAAQTNLVLLSLHVSSRFQNNILEEGVFIGSGKPYTHAALLKNAYENAAFVRSAFGPQVDLLVENNNDLRTDAYEIVTEPSFISELCLAVDAGLLLDVAHARISAHNKGLTDEEYFTLLPLDQVRQVHLSKHGIRGEWAYDAHCELDEDDWSFFMALLDGLPRLEYATIEVYQNLESLLVMLDRLHAIAKGDAHA